MLGCSIVAIAQNEKPVKTGNEWRMPGDVLSRSQKFAGSLKKALNLDDATTKKLFQAYINNAKSQDEIPMLSISPEQKIEKLKENKVKFEKTIKGILTPVQFEQYLKLEADKKSTKK